MLQAINHRRYSYKLFINKCAPRRPSRLQTTHFVTICKLVEMTDFNQVHTMHASQPCIKNITEHTVFEKYKITQRLNSYIFCIKHQYVHYRYASIYNYNPVSTYSDSKMQGSQAFGKYKATE